MEVAEVDWDVEGSTTLEVSEDVVSFGCREGSMETGDFALEVTGFISEVE